MVTQMLRQGDAEVFKLYTQAKLGMMREALAKLDRMANERPRNLFTERLRTQLTGFIHTFRTVAWNPAQPRKKEHCNRRT
jgi:hypothetical protein